MHAFIIRIWIEPREDKETEPIWRIVLEHVGGGARFCFDRLDQIAIHLLPYVEAMGVNVDKHPS